MSALPRGASVIGREHVRLGRNNQDGWCVRTNGTRVVGVVTDGCGSQPGSEVGARLGAAFLAQWLAERPFDSNVPTQAVEALQGYLRTVTEAVGGLAAVEAYCLFTVLAVVREGARTVVFGVGDGGVWVDGRLTALDPGPENAPEYAGYGLAGRTVRPVVHFDGPCTQVAVMSDGLVDLPAEALEALVRLDSHNPLTLQRRLNVLAQDRKFADDSTLVVLQAVE